MALTATGATIALSAILPSGENRYIALYEDAECTTEIDVEGYARVEYTGWTSALGGMARANTGPITWSEFTNGGAFEGIAICDAASGGNKLAIGNPKSEGPVIIDPGDFPELDVGTLVVEA